MNNVFVFLSLITDACENISVLRTVLFIKKLLDIVFILVPMGLIVMLSLDFAKNVISGKEDEMRKNLNLAIKRLIFIVALFLVPTIVKFAINSLGSFESNYTKCLAVTSESIDRQIAENKSKCTGNDYEWDETTSECIIKSTPPEINTTTSNGKTIKINSNKNSNSDSSNSSGSNSNNGSLQYFDQCDSRWKNEGFCGGKYNICYDGCGAAALAMMAVNFGSKTTASLANPKVVRDYLCKNGIHSGGGLSHSVLTNKTLLDHYGLKGKQVHIKNTSSKYNSDQAKKLKKYVDDGKGVIILIPHHFVVVGQNTKCKSNEVYLYNVAGEQHCGCKTMKELWKSTYNWRNRCAANSKCGWEKVWVYEPA